MGLTNAQGTLLSAWGAMCLQFLFSMLKPGEQVCKIVTSLALQYHKVLSLKHRGKNMSQVRHKSKRRNSDEYCLLCGGCDHPTDPLQWIQVGGGRVDWAHGHCHAKVDIRFAQKSMEKAVQLLSRVKFDAPVAGPDLIRETPCSSPELQDRTGHDG